MQKFQITHIIKSDRNDRFERIEYVGSSAPYWAREPAEVARMIISKEATFYVLGKDGKMVDVEAVTSLLGQPKEPFIRTVPDHTVENNLLHLPPFVLKEGIVNSAIRPIENK